MLAKQAVTIRVNKKEMTYRYLHFLNELGQWAKGGGGGVKCKLMTVGAGNKIFTHKLVDVH